MGLLIERNYMESTKSNWFRTHIISMVIICLLIAITANNQNKRQQTEDTIKDLTTKVTHYQQRDGVMVASAASAKLEADRMKGIVKESSRQVKVLAEAFHIVKGLSVTNTVTKFDTIQVIYKDSLEKFKPFLIEGEKVDKNYSFNYKSTEKGFAISNLMIPDTVVRISGVKRKWFLGKETYTVDETHSNPHIVTEGAQHFEVTPKKHWYNSKILYFGLGVVAGSYLAK